MTATTDGYDWIEGWAESPGKHDHVWSHHGLTLTADGHVVSFDAGTATLLLHSRDGALERRVPVPAFEAHDLLVVRRDGEELVWVADIGLRSVQQPDGTFDVIAGEQGGQALLVRLDGTVAQRLPTPPAEEYAEGRYCPAAVVVDAEEHGGSGDVWVADAYGQSLLHRFRADGTHLMTLRGTERGGPGRLDCPHGLLVDRRDVLPRLLVADRGNARVLVYSLEGDFLGTMGEGQLVAPSSFAVSGSTLVVAEHRGARLALFDCDDRLLRFLGSNEQVVARPGWPNAVATTGRVVAPQLEPGLFNSPHGLAAGSGGELFVAEWVVGGRMIRLDPS